MKFTRAYIFGWSNSGCNVTYLYTLCCPSHRSTWDLQGNSHNFTLSTLVSGKYSCRRQQIFLFLALYFLTTSGFVFVLYVHMALYCLTFEHIYILYDAKLFIMVNKMSISSPTFMKTCLPKNLSICNPIRYVKSESCQLTCNFIENFIFLNLNPIPKASGELVPHHYFEAFLCTPSQNHYKWLSFDLPWQPQWFF